METSAFRHPASVAAGGSRAAFIEQAPISGARIDVKELNQLLTWASEKKASDIVLCSNAKPMVKLHGDWVSVHDRELTVAELGVLLSQIYQMSATAELTSGTPLDFAHTFQVSRGEYLSFRVNATAVASMSPGEIGLDVTFRTIPKAPPTVQELGLEKGLLDAAVPTFGLVLITGPTGSGKTTLLASLLRMINETTTRRIMTYESPIEFNLRDLPNRKGPMVTQSEVPLHVREGFARCVANSLRRAPDVILIGESRDRETIAGAVTASQTGHSVYTTVHTNNVVMAIERMTDEFPAEDRWGMAVKLIDASRLIVNQRLYRNPNGGRTAIREYVPMTEDIRRRLIQAGESKYIKLLDEHLREHGQTLLQDAERKTALGLMYESDYQTLKSELSHIASQMEALHG